MKLNLRFTVHFLLFRQVKMGIVRYLLRFKLQKTYFWQKTKMMYCKSQFFRYTSQDLKNICFLTEYSRYTTEHSSNYSFSLLRIITNLFRLDLSSIV